MLFRSSWAARLLLALTLHTSYLTLHTSAQRPPAQPNASEILHRMQKLNVLGSVLYIVAHPDDENTRLIAWLANGKKVRTGNLSLTRGDGGQNLIGPELGDALGIIRTQELMEARRIDGGEQFFTRAVDFGFSKNAKESFEKWGKQEVLSDVVRVIRMFRPDIIITRFAPDRSAGHGHHEASAILAEEAFDLAGDPKAFPEQLTQGLDVWQPRRLFFNGSTWWKKNLAEIAKPDSGWYTVDVGGYDPLLGLSYTEIAGRSRSLHKSQGFGAAETRGEMLEYLKLVKGDKPKGADIFEGIDMTWGRVEGGSPFAVAVDQMILAYTPADPGKSVESLGRLGTQMWSNCRTAKKECWWSELKANDAESLIAKCAGLSIEAIAKSPMTALDDSMSVEFSFVQRTATPELRLNGFNEPDMAGVKVDAPLKVNKPGTADLRFKADYGSVDQPYWLAKPHHALYEAEPHERVLPVADGQGQFWYSITGNEGIRHDSHVSPIYKWVDRVDGERIRPAYITPVASIVPERNTWLIQELGASINVDVVALTDNLSGILACSAPKGWIVTPTSVSIEGMKRDERRTFTFQHTGSNKPEPGILQFLFTSTDGQSKSNKTLHEIDYPHIVPQVYYTPAEVKMIPLSVETTAKTVGYIKGAGDEVPQAIDQLGVKVDVIDASAGSAGHLTLESLKKYDAIVTGIRAYNTTQELKTLNPVLMKYVEQGGTLVCQYNTRSSDMVLPDSLFGPYPFKLTRDRVTVEEAPPTFLAKDHPLLNTPNKITAADFEGWVQERGLYFCGSPDPHYTPLIAWNDPGEQPLNGGLITCDYGKGRYVYTGISFFRQLPSGVPGAYRLFANLISKRGQ